MRLTQTPQNIEFIASLIHMHEEISSLSDKNGSMAGSLNMTHDI